MPKIRKVNKKVTKDTLSEVIEQPEMKENEKDVETIKETKKTPEVELERECTCGLIVKLSDEPVVCTCGIKHMR